MSVVLTPRPVSPGVRAGAYLLDLVVAVVLSALAGWLSSSWVVAVIVLVECGVVVSLARAATGRTLGGLATRTVALAAGTDHAPGLTRQGARSALLAALHLTVLGPLVTMLISRDGRDWVDGLTRTELIELRAQPQVMTAVDAYGRPTVTVEQGFVPGRPAGQVAHETSSFAPQPGSVAPQTSSFAPPAEPGAEIGAGAGLTAAAPPSRLMLVVDTGLRVPIAGTLVIGRTPDADTGSGERAVALPDPTRSMSRTHLRLTLAADGTLWAEDAFSGNGTTLRQPDGALVEVPRGQRMPVVVGSTLLVGERTLIIEG